MTKAVSVEDELAERLRFQASLLDAVEQAVIATDLNGAIRYWNRFAERLYGWRADEVTGRNILEVTPVDAARAAEIMTRLGRGESWSGEIELRRRDGSSFPAHVTDSPILDASGALVGVVGVSMDVSERRQAEERQRLLAAELDHRVKNTIATVQSIALQTLGAGERSAALAGRLQALANAHGLLARSRWRGAPLRALVETALMAYADEPGRVSVAGPDLMLEAKSAETFSLLLHELATNAAKYGAFAQPGGRVEAAWRTSPDGGRLLFEWAERDGPAVRPPERRGFGSLLIERSVAYELDGATRLDFLPSGVRCTVELPMPLAGPGPGGPD